MLNSLQFASIAIYFFLLAEKGTWWYKAS